ncbi:hypothetical protein ACQP1G_09270 [Nocardia sp. CA-107356]|uniref:hypothetical protein n=1 Tax=Nocardia sp. CA-107356 TaxID=3239972 RepID=UPI003D8D048B
MIKLVSAALLIATAAATLQLLPAAPAQAQSPSCAKAIELINAAIDMSGGTMDDATTRALSDRLSGLAALAVGVEKDAITGYANALVDENITDLDPATDELNRVCA